MGRKIEFNEMKMIGQACSYAHKTMVSSGHKIWRMRVCQGLSFIHPATGGFLTRNRNLNDYLQTHEQKECPDKRTKVQSRCFAAEDSCRQRPQWTTASDNSRSDFIGHGINHFLVDASLHKLVCRCAEYFSVKLVKFVGSCSENQ